jgi:hypothetical protein
VSANFVEEWLNVDGFQAVVLWHWVHVWLKFPWTWLGLVGCAKSLE